MRQKKNIVLILSVFIGLVSFPSEAQENKHSVWVTYYNSPPTLSYKEIYRDDWGNEPFKKATINGYGVGFSYRLFKVFSPEFNVMYYSMNGIDSHSDNTLKFVGIQLRLGGLLHIRKRSPEINVGFGYVSGNTRVVDYDDIEEKGKGIGLYLGTSFLVDLNSLSSLKFGINVVPQFYGFDSYSSYDLGNIIMLNTELSISYVFRF